MQPKYWKGIKTFLTLETIACIIGIVAMSIHLIVSLITGTVSITKYLTIMLNGSQEQMESLRQDFWVVLDVYSLIIAVSNFIFSLPGAVLSLIFVKKIKNNYPKVTNKRDSIKWGILAIVSGLLGMSFSIPAGIMILITKKKDFLAGQQDNIYDV